MWEIQKDYPGALEHLYSTPLGWASLLYAFFFHVKRIPHSPRHSHRALLRPLRLPWVRSSSIRA